ncbi:hypothetical protein P8452_41769 [Trifolium repens]|nr:hypothetical protein P8452_41769 [Trifolium repens]
MILDYQPFFTPSPGKNGEVVQHIMDVATMKIPENFKAVLHELVLWYLKARYQGKRSKQGLMLIWNSISWVLWLAR